MRKKIMILMAVMVTGCFLLTGLAMAQVDADKIAQALSEGTDITTIMEEVLNDPANAGQDPADLLVQASRIITTITVQNAVASGQDVTTAITETSQQIIESVAQVAAQTGIPDPVNVVNEVVNSVVESATTAVTAATGSSQDAQAVADSIQQGASTAANAGFVAAGSDITVSDTGNGQGMEQTGGEETTAEATTDATTADETTTESTVVTTTVLTTTSSSSSSSSSSSTTSETTASPAQ